MDTQSDWIVIVIAAILNMVVGFFWYSKWLFGTVWMKLVDKKEKDLRFKKRALIWSFVVSLIVAFFLDFFARHLGVTTVSDGMFLAFCFWLGFVATTQISSVIWCRKPWKLFAINAGCRLLAYLVMGGVIGS